MSLGKRSGVTTTTSACGAIGKAVVVQAAEAGVIDGIGPFGLLKETRMNHYGKLLFRWIYWHILLKGKEMPIDSKMSMAGKKM